MLSLGHILTSDLVAADLFTHPLSGLILLTWPPFLHQRWFHITFVRLTITATSNKLILVVEKSQGKYPKHELFTLIKDTNMHIRRNQNIEICI